MQCVKPFWLKKEQIEVPCGHCVADRIAYSREWTVRLLHEMNYHSECSFVTLTYDDFHLPKNGSVSVADLQGFFKRLRKNSGRSLSYFACGEYGDPAKTFRPHYHMILFGLGRSSCQYFPSIGKYLSEDIAGAWSYGIHEVDTVTYDSCRYVTDYIMKKYNGERAVEVYGERTVPFMRSSKGLGLSYLQENWRELLQAQCVTVRGVKMSLPRYYLKKLKEMYEEEVERKKRSESSENSDIIPLFEAYQNNIVTQAVERNEQLDESSLSGNFARIAKRGVNLRKDTELRDQLVRAALYDNIECDLSNIQISHEDYEISAMWRKRRNEAIEARLVAKTNLKEKPLE